MLRLQGIKYALAYLMINKTAQKTNRIWRTASCWMGLRWVMRPLYSQVQLDYAIIKIKILTKLQELQQTWTIPMFQDRQVNIPRHREGPTKGQSQLRTTITSPLREMHWAVTMTFCAQETVKEVHCLEHPLTPKVAMASSSHTATIIYSCNKTVLRQWTQRATWIATTRQWPSRQRLGTRTQRRILILTKRRTRRSSMWPRATRARLGAASHQVQPMIRARSRQTAEFQCHLHQLPGSSHSERR